MMLAAYEDKVETKKLLESYKGIQIGRTKQEWRETFGTKFETVSGIRFTEQFQAAREKKKERFLLKTKFEFIKQIVKSCCLYYSSTWKENLQVKAPSSPTDLVTRLDKEI